MENKDIVIQFSKELRKLRKKYKLTQEELTEKSDISAKNIQYLESTKKPTCPSLRTLQKISNGLGIKLKNLLKNLE